MRMYAWQWVNKLAVPIGVVVLCIALVWAGEERNWFAVVGSFRHETDARQFAEDLLRKRYRPEIYLSENAYFAVTLGGYLDREQARRLVEMARAEGIGREAYVWRSDHWGENRLRPVEPLPPEEYHQRVWRLPLAEIQQQLAPLLDQPDILRPYVSKTASLSIFHPEVGLSPRDQSLSIFFNFVYAEVDDPRYQYMKTDRRKGFGVVTAKVHLDGVCLVLGELAFKELPSNLPGQIVDTLEFNWLRHLRKRIAGRTLAETPFREAHMEITHDFITLFPPQEDGPVPPG